MKLRWKMLLQPGLSSFLLMVAILLFTVDYTTDSLFKLRKEGSKYALADLQIRAKASTSQLKNQIISFYARAESLDSLQFRPLENARDFIRKRIVSAEETDTVLLCRYKSGTENDPELFDIFTIRQENGKSVENVNLEHIFSHPDFKNYLKEHLSPVRPVLLLIPGDPGEIWVLYKTLPSKDKTGIVSAVRFNQDYLFAGTSGHPSGYMMFKAEKPVFGSTRCLKNPLTDSVHKEVAELIDRVDSQKSPFAAELIRESGSGAAWFIIGTAIKPDQSTPDLKMIRIYDYNDVMPQFTQLLEAKVYQIRLYVLIFMIVGLVVLTVPMVIFSRQLSRPLSRAAELADQLSQGDFSPSQWETKTGITEVDHMMKAMSYMRDRLNSSIEKLKRSHTREIEARTDAENANRLKSDFLDAVSREYKEPLNALTGFAMILNKRIADGQPTDTKELKSILDAISSNLTKLAAMGDLLNELNCLSLETEEELKPAECDLFKILHELNVPSVKAASEHNIVMEFRYTNEIPYTVYTDRNKMMQMLKMMVHTICISTPEKASVFFNCDKKNEMLVMSGKSSVANPALAEYKQYTQSKSSLRAYKYVQEIIRLTIVRHLITLLGGTLDIILHPAGGYEFLITFAISDMETPANIHGAADLGISISTSASQNCPDRHCSLDEIFAKIRKGKPECRGPVSILLGEDDGSHKLLLEIMLRGAGCEVRSADNASQTREKMKEKMPDILLLDLRMTISDRSTFLTDLRKMPDAEGIFIFPLANSWDEKEKIRLISAGADECLVKPLDMDALTKAVQNAFLIRGNMERTH